MPQFFEGHKVAVREKPNRIVAMVQCQGMGGTVSV